MESMADLELVARAQRGESPAFDALMLRYQTRVSNMVYRYVEDRDVASDLVQDIFVKIYTHLKRFKGESSFSTWLFRIAANDCIDHIRRQKTRKETSLELISEYGFDPADPRDESVDERLIEAADHQMVRLAIRQLDADQKMVLVMKVYEEMTFEDIAAALALPLSTVKSRLYKALEHVGRQVRRRQLIERIGT
ncbi:MAG: sigma-70 family RNA polymerase sigma factor [Acidobacteria bacterium]|nr:sigma-70 family RNA polymerase sigma factor [Acidobacteriota bacterium]